MNNCSYDDTNTRTTISQFWREGRDLMKKKYSISGIDCANCAAKLEAKMNELPEVGQVVLTFATGQLSVEAEDPDAVLPLLQSLADKMEPGTVIAQRSGKTSSHSHGEEGCCSHEHDHSHAHDHSHDHAHVHAHGHKEDSVRGEALLLAAGAVCFGAGLLISYVWPDLPFAGLAVYLIAYFILGGEVVYTAIRNLFQGKIFDENFLMSLATVGAFVIGEYPEAVGVMLFYRIGELFEDVAVRKSRKQIMEAVDMRPERVRLYQEDEVTECGPEEIKVGQIIEVRPGDRIPLDGVIVQGESRIDTSAVTGEPVPVSVAPGSQVMSGCVNTNGLLRIQVEKALEDSMVTRILEAVENAAASKPKIDRFITRFAAIYTPFVVLLAVLTALIPSLVTGDWEHWVYTALTFLVISCPCALVLSVPLAFFAGIGAGSRKGILFKGGASLEMLSAVKAIVMDKTGTVTEGSFCVTGVETEELLRYAACGERHSTHPIASSIMTVAAEKGITAQEAQEIEEISGKGVRAVADGKTILCGSARLLELYSVQGIPVADPSEIQGTQVYLAVDGKYAGRFVISDTIKEDSSRAVSEMRRRGKWTALLTGDMPENTASVAERIGADAYYARLLPEEKLKKLQEIRQSQGAVMFIGDGINDAPVLAGADVGAAMGSGADAAIEAADVVFMTSRLTAVNDSLRIAEGTKRVAMQNVIGALGIKALVMILGLAGMASMWMAVFADSGVAMLCVLNSIRILFGKKE